AVACFAAPSSASASGLIPPFRIEAGANVHFRITSGAQGSPAQLGPWYLYWPLEAHFQYPAPYGAQYPYWPAAQFVPPQQYSPASPVAPIMPPAFPGSGR